MNTAKKTAICQLIEKQLGAQAAATVWAALEIAWTEWTPEYEEKYGTWVAEYLLS